MMTLMMMAMMMSAMMMSAMMASDTHFIMINIYILNNN